MSCSPAWKISFLSPFFPCFVGFFFYLGAAFCASLAPAALPGSCLAEAPHQLLPKKGVFILASPRLGWPQGGPKDGQMDTWRPWCNGEMLVVSARRGCVGICQDLWVYGMICAVCRVELGLCIFPQLPAEPRACGVPQFPRSQRSLEALQCSRAAGVGVVILALHSGQVWGVLCQIPQPIPLLEGTGPCCVFPNPASHHTPGKWGWG